MDYESLFSKVAEPALHGRYITLDDILPLLGKPGRGEKVREMGRSVQGRPLLRYDFGHGPKRILLWSQMHGNESTATKALFDLFNLLDSGSELAERLKAEFTFCFVPMLNPDGALAYTRVNAAEVDLNRDFHDLTQPESRALVELFEDFQPDFCYNLHDQRTIFGAGDSGKPATISFLAPSFDRDRNMNDVRAKAVEVIVSMNEALQQIIPGQVGRFDDSFNINCAGDNFQFRGVPTILIEAGHFPGDYDREETRKLFFVSLISGFVAIYENVVVNDVLARYSNIPENKVVFFDFVYRNVRINYDGKDIITNFAAQYREELFNKKLFFNAYITELLNPPYFGHIEFDADGATFSNDSVDFPEIGQKANFFVGKDVKFVNGLKEM